MLVQAATGNTSIKLEGVLWIKASGKWLAHANQEEILIPVNLAETRQRIEQNADPAGQTVIVGRKPLGTSVETALHAVLPHRVVLHVHSVNTIAWAVREDGERELARLLDGVAWKWIPYLASGLPLARAVQRAVADSPQTQVLVLSNHGLVICGEDCGKAETLLRAVERRVAIPPRRAPEPDWGELSRLAEGDGAWRVPPSIPINAMATDRVSRRILSGGVLYPCQAIFLGTKARTLPSTASATDVAGLDEPFVMIEDIGTLVQKKRNSTESATLAGLSLVLQRIPGTAPLRYLAEDQVQELLCADVYNYRERVEDNGAGRPAFQSKAIRGIDVAELNRA
jgi:rhamnose utilization protein RhaD (predicted bifunctional aldolase and dehydrogenase)